MRICIAVASEALNWIHSCTTTWLNRENYTMFHKRTPFFFHDLFKWWSVYMKFLPVVAEEILIQNIWTIYGNWLNIFASRDVTLTSYCVTGTNFLSQLVLSVATLLRWWKIWFVDDKFLKFYSCSHKKRAKQSHLRVCGDSWIFTCSSKTVH